MVGALDFDDRDDLPDEDVRPVRRRCRSSPIRFVSPTTFGFAAILFFLPWTDISCNGPRGKEQLVTQSGFQSATGTYTEGEFVSRMANRNAPVPNGEVNKKQAGKPKADDPMIVNEAKKKEKFSAPLLGLYALWLLIGVIAPFAIASDWSRGWIVLLAALLALFVLGAQAIVGFPLENLTKEMNDKMDADRRQRGGRGAEENMGAELAAALVAIKFSYLPAFWASIGLVFASAVIGVVEVTRAPQTRRRHRARYDDDD
jgi:hypothetical protein